MRSNVTKMTDCFSSGINDILWCYFTIKLTTPKSIFSFFQLNCYSESKIKSILKAYFAITYLKTKHSYAYRKEFCLCNKNNFNIMEEIFLRCFQSDSKTQICVLAKKKSSAITHFFYRVIL